MSFAIENIYEKITSKIAKIVSNFAELRKIRTANMELTSFLKSPCRTDSNILFTKIKRCLPL